MPDNRRTAVTKGAPAKDNTPCADPAESMIPEEISEVLKDVPHEAREVLRQFMVVQSSMVSRVSPEAEVTKKVTGDHITQMLQTNDKAMEHTFKDLNHKRFFTFGSGVLGLIALIAIIMLLRDDPDLMEKVLTIVFSGGLGVAGGFGIGYVKGKKDE